MTRPLGTDTNVGRETIIKRGGFIRDSAEARFESDEILEMPARIKKVAGSTF